VWRIIPKRVFYTGASVRLPVLLFVIAQLAVAASSASQEWPFYGGDQAGTKYSLLDQINRENVRNLRVAWEWRTGETPLPEYGTRPGAFEVTPLMVGGVLYLSTPYNRLVALDARTGKQKWAFDPKAYQDGQVPNGTGFVHRGVALWRDPETHALRVFINSRYHLIALDSETGQPVKSFGENGSINLVSGLRWDTNPKNYTNTSPPVVYKNLVIVGNGVADRLVYKKDPPGDVRAFDARSGKLVWTFHTVPLSNESGADTWGDSSASFTGHTNVWAPMTLDEERGLLYMPVSTPSNDFYGGRRPGANLFADSIVCLNAATGIRKWHYQLVHHGLWDYDMPSPPNLVSIQVDGKKIDAVVQLTKQGFAFVFDRVSGKPVWPIEERRVPASDVEGEHAWPMQPVPAKPPAFAPQGTSVDDAFDLTPALKAEAQAEMKKLRLGPLFTPPSFEGTLMRPGIIGGANWGGASFDPETHILYVKSSNVPAVAKLVKPEAGPSGPTGALTDAEYVMDGGTNASFHQGLPLTKPPYGQLTAINLDQGEIVWQIPIGDDTAIRNNPSLKGVTLPPLLGAPGVAGTLLTKGGLVFVGGGDTAFHAIDRTNGKELWNCPLTVRTTGTPMTYSANGRQYVVIASGSGSDARLFAFALPESAT
jgi:quinoprotein glucose dehydrogenase